MVPVMKPAILLFLLPVVCFALGPSDRPEGFQALSIGDCAPDFKLPGTDGRTYQLSDFAEPDILMVYFTGTHCPTSHGVEGRLQQFLEEMKDESFNIVAINPNHNDGLRPDEFSYSIYSESFEDSKRYAEDLGWTFPFLYDGEEQMIARAYGCLATPHVFIFDKDRKLRYQGRFDDSRFADPKSVKHPDARNAVEALLTGEPVAVEKTRPHGCSTKWKGRSAHVKEDELKWQVLPAVVEEIDSNALKKMRENASGKIRLFNVWATWCAPCKQEMPDLSAIVRKFSRREFEIITISLDAPEDKKKVEAFLGQNRMVVGDELTKSLKAEGRTTNNYIFTGSNTDDLAAALDPEWPGPVPYSLLIDKEGEVLMRVTGMIDAYEVNKEVLEQLGTVWQPKAKPWNQK
ncbi:redoxin domain-containing protein [bacterium]|nr:redoxin domain-containing protein [bacterium]